MAKILVIDDSMTVRNQVRAILEGNGHILVEAEDGLDGLEKVKLHRDLELIICDVSLPHLDGVTLLEKLHEIEGYVKVPIFMLTTEGSKQLKDRAKAAGMVAWILKPVSADKLILAVTKILGK